jgi:hypothetical protein
MLWQILHKTYAKYDPNQDPYSYFYQFSFHHLACEDNLSHLFSNALQPIGNIDFIEADSAHNRSKSADAYTEERA